MAIPLIAIGALGSALLPSGQKPERQAVTPESLLFETLLKGAGISRALFPSSSAQSSMLGDIAVQQFAVDLAAQFHSQSPGKVPRG